MSYTYSGYRSQSQQTGQKPAPIRPGNFYVPRNLNQVSEWTERKPPEKVSIDVIGALPHAIRIPGKSLEAPVNWAMELASTINPALRMLGKDADVRAGMDSIIKWVGDVTPIGAIARGGTQALDELSKAQSAVANAADARLVPHWYNLPDSTVITRQMELDASRDPQFRRWAGRTVGEFKQDLADRGFNVKIEDDVMMPMTWQQVADVVRSDELMGKYQFGQATVSSSLPTHMLYQIATDPLNLLFGAGAYVKVVQASRMMAVTRDLAEATAAFEAAQKAHKGVRAAREAWEAAQVAYDARTARGAAINAAAGWSQHPAIKLASHAGNGLRQVWGVGYLEDVARAGLRVARAPSPVQSARAMATSGTSQAGTAQGVGHLLRYPRQYLLSTKNASPFRQYYRTGMAMQFGGVTVEHGAGAIQDVLDGEDGADANIVSGFFGGIHDAFQAINNKSILSDDAIYTLATVWLLPTFDTAASFRPKGASIEGAPRVSDWVKELEPTFKTEAKGVGIRSAKRAEQTFFDRFEGGRDGFALLRYMTIGRIAFKRYIQQNPKLKLRIEMFEDQIRLKHMAESLQPMIQSLIDEGGLNEKHLVEEFIEWAQTHGRSIVDEEGGLKPDVPREVAHSLTGEMMIQQFNEYVRAMRRLHEIVDPRLEATIVRADRMGQGALDDLIAFLTAEVKDGMLDSRVLRARLYRTQAMFEDPGMNPAFWDRQMNLGVAAGKNKDFMVEAQPILDELAKVRDNAATERELFHEAHLDEANAADSPITITDFGDNSPLTPEGVRLVQSQADIDVVSIEQNVPFAAAKRVRLRMEQAFRAKFTSKGAPKVEAQWAFNRNIRRHSDKIFTRLTRGYKPGTAQKPKDYIPAEYKDARMYSLDNLRFFVEHPNPVGDELGELLADINKAIEHISISELRSYISARGDKNVIRHEATVDTPFGKQDIIVSRDNNGEINGILAIDKLREGYRDVYVRESSRRKGVATKLYEAAEQMGYKVRDDAEEVKAPEGNVEFETDVAQGHTQEGRDFKRAYNQRPAVAATQVTETILPPLRTINPKTGELIGHGNSGYQVGLHPGDFSLLAKGDKEGLALTLQMVRRYYQQAEVSSIVDESGRIVLEPSVHVKSLDEAMRLARERNQEFIYDHSTKQRIEVEYPPESPRVEPVADAVWELPKEHLTDIEAKEPNGYGPLHRAWWEHMRRGVALGRVTLEDLEGMGVDELQMELKLFETGINTIRPLPTTLYHATGAMSDIRAEGLKTGVDVEASGKKPAGLGGTPMFVSMTDSLKGAEELADDYRLLVDLLQGRITPKDLFDEVFHLDPNHAHTHSLLNELNILESRIARYRELGEDSRANPVDALPPGMGDAAKGLTNSERIGIALTSFFQTEYLWARQVVGGRRNPVFVGSNTEIFHKFKGVNRDDIGVLTVHPRKGAQGYRRDDFGITEWRTWHGDAVVVEGGTRNRYGLADAEAVARKPWDELRESELAAIKERKAEEVRMKREWKALKEEADKLRIIKVNKNWFDRYKEGRFEVSLDDLRHLQEVQDTIRREYGSHYDVGPGPKTMVPWQAQDGPLQALFVERSLLKNVLFDYGPLGRLTSMVEFITEPVSASKMVVDSRRMYMNYLLPLGAKPHEVRRYFNLLMEETKKHRLGPSDAPTYRGTTALPESVLRDTARAVFDKKTVAAVEARYGGRWAAPMNMAYNSLIRRIDQQVMAGGRPGILSRAVKSGYSQFHTAKGLGALAEGTRLISKVVYPLVRFTIDIRWQAMNYLEADILALGLDGLRSTRARGNADIIMRHGRKDINVSETAENLHGTRNQLNRVPGRGGPITMDEAAAAGVFQTHKRMWPVFSRQGNLRREENIIGLIDSLPTTGPEYINLVKRFGKDETTWSRQIEDMLYSYDKKGVAFSIRHEAERIRRGDGWTDEEWVAMQPFISRAIELNQKTFDDLVQLHIGNINRSRLERVLNSYWLYWPIGYQLKAGRWLLKTMAQGAFGAKSNMLGAYQIDRWAQDFKERLVVSPGFRREFEDNEALWFAAAMFLPLTPMDVGVSLNRGVRYVGGNPLGLWPEYEGIDGPFDVIQRMLSLGPLYTAQLFDSVLKSGYVQELMPSEPGIEPLQ